MISSLPIRSILVATDLTEGSDELVRTAAEFAAVAGAELNIVHALEGISSLAGGRDVLTVQRTIHEKSRMLHDQAIRNIDPVVKLNLVRAAPGSPDEVIRSAAKDAAADLIILGAHENRGIADRYLGSTAERVLKHASVPCLLINGPLHLPIRRVVVPTDQSEPAHQGLDAALHWAAHLGGHRAAAVSLVHVLDADIDAQMVPWLPLEIRKQVEQAANEAKRRTKVSVEVGIDLIEGADPTEALVGYAREKAADLIVMGTQSDGILIRALLRSVSSAMVRRAPTPILVVPKQRETIDVSPEAIASARLARAEPRVF